MARCCVPGRATAASSVRTDRFPVHPFSSSGPAADLPAHALVVPRSVVLSALLPPVRDDREFRDSPRDEQSYRAAVREIARRHGLPTDRLTKYPGGSTIVFAVGANHVVKLFEPIFPDAARTEHAVLTHVHGRLSVPTPRVHAFGTLEGWRYVVMEQLRGSVLADVWDAIPPSERVWLLERLGKAVAGLHALPLPEGLPGPEWTDFVRHQAERCVRQQRRNGLAEEWVEQIPGFLASQDLRALAEAPQALLHTEIMREHVLVREGRAGWELGGLFDFEPARLGAAEYDVASVGVFLAAGEPELLRAYLRGYGYADRLLTDALQERFMVYTLLHRYSNLRWYLERLPARSASTLHALAREWFAFE